MDFEVGTVVYAKLRGYPWWPARIEKEGNLPKEVHSKKPKGQVTSVKFFGTKDYGWVNKDDLKPFVQNEAEESLEKMKNSKRTNKLLEKSIRDAFDPSSLDEDISSSMDTDDFNHDSGSSPNNENDEGNSNKSSLSSSTTPKSTATVRGKVQGKGRKISSAASTTNIRKRKGRQPSETSNDLNNGGKSSKKRKANNSGSAGSSHNYDYDDDDDDDDEDGKGETNIMDVDENNNGNSDKTEKSTTTATNVAKETNDSSEHQVEPSAHDHSSPTENQESSTSAAVAARSNKSSEHEKLEKKLLRLRRRLQRLVLKDEGIEPQDVEKVNEIFEEIEKFPVSVPMLRGTKVGKLMREISRKKFDYDPSNIVGKSTDLISRWQTLLEDNNFIIQIDNAPSPKDEASTSTHTNHDDQSSSSTTKLAKDTNDITTTIDTIDDDDVVKDDDDFAKGVDVAKGDDDNDRMTCHAN